MPVRRREVSFNSAARRRGGMQLGGTKPRAPVAGSGVNSRPPHGGMRTAPHAGIPTCRNADRTVEGQPRVHRSSVCRWFQRRAPPKRQRIEGSYGAFHPPPNMRACWRSDLPGSERPTFRQTGHSVCRAAGRSGSRSSEVLAIRLIGIPACRCPDMPTIRLTTISECRGAGAPIS